LTRRNWQITIGASVVAALLIAGLSVWILNSGGSKHNGTGPSTTPTAPTTSSAVTATTPTPATGNNLVPKTGVSFGVSASTGDFSQPARISAVNELQQSLGVNVSIVHTYRTLDQPIGTPSDLQFIADGKTLLISWTGTDTIKMGAGDVDAAIAQRAREVAALKVPVFFEYRWEMDRPNLASVVHSGKDYISAWNRVRSVFRAQKVTNAQFVWCPLASGFATGRAQTYYPGDAQVDWVCADLYSPINKATQSFATLAAPFLAWADSHHKPIMFGEFGAAATWGSAKRAEWISGIESVVQAHPLIKALVYYNSDAGEGRYSLSDDSRALGALAAVARKFGAKAI
jgi:hypothetical protein